MDINLKPEERHRMFSERMTFWNMFQYKEMLEEYAVDNKEARMLIEIESAIDESEDNAEDDDEDEDEDVAEEEDEVSGRRRGGGRRWQLKGKRKLRSVVKEVTGFTELLLWRNPLSSRSRSRSSKISI